MRDITEQVQLAERLKAANEKATREIDMLMAIMHVENTMLTDFLQTVKEGLNNVNEILKTPAKSSDKLKTKLETIFRIVHKLKGDSTVIGLEFITEKFHNLELEIARHRDKKAITGEDFLPLVVHLNQLISDFDIIGNLQDKMQTSDLPQLKQEQSLALPDSSPEMPASSRTERQWKTQFSHLVQQVSADYNKEVRLDTSDFDASLLSEEQKDPVKDIVVQSLRNAIAHGLELPAMRASSGKPPRGHLRVALQRTGMGLQLTIKDDGQGIDLEKIKARAIASGLATEEKLGNWHNSKLLSLIFQQGVTTAEESTVHAGHGVGMDLIRSNVGLLSGQVRVRYKAGRYTEFQYNFPERITELRN